MTPTSKFNFIVGNPATRQGIRVTMKDLDNDGADDLIVGDSPGSGAEFAGFSGRTLSGNTAPAAIAGFDVFGGTDGVYVG